MGIIVVVHDLFPTWHSCIWQHSGENQLFDWLVNKTLAMLHVTIYIILLYVLYIFTHYTMLHIILLCTLYYLAHYWYLRHSCQYIMTHNLHFLRHCLNWFIIIRIPLNFFVEIQLTLKKRQYLVVNRKRSSHVDILAMIHEIIHDWATISECSPNYRMCTDGCCSKHKIISIT